MHIRIHIWTVHFRVSPLHWCHTCGRHPTRNGHRWPVQRLMRHGGGQLPNGGGGCDGTIHHRWHLHAHPTRQHSWGFFWGEDVGQLSHPHVFLWGTKREHEGFVNLMVVSSMSWPLARTYNPINHHEVRYSLLFLG